MQELLQLIVNGLITGSILAVGAIGITLVFGILDIGNFAHGEYLTIGMYAAWVVNVELGLPFAVAIVAAVLVAGAIGVLLDMGVLQSFRTKGAGALLIVTLALSLIIRNVLLFIFGPAPKSFDVDVTSVYVIGGVRISFPQLLAIALTVVVIIFTAWLLARTRTGKSMRAMADDRDLAGVAGVNMHRTRRSTWLISSGLAGLGGVLVGLTQGAFNPETGFNLLLLLFTAAILGGLRSAYGTLAGGLILGLSMEVSTWDGLFGGLDSIYKPVLAFVVLIVLLMIRPQGLFGKAQAT
jgi:branched-subunit amino acid ABC-type transport system permease component